jgi:hypothetical protein
MDKFGKYWGTDSTKPAHIRSAVLDEFYEDITYVDLIIKSYIEFNVSIENTKAWALEKINLVGVENLTDIEIEAATRHGLI